VPTLAELRSDVLTEADLVQGQVDDADVTRLLNEALGELHELLVQSYEGVFSTSATFSLGAGVDFQALPSDFYQATDVEDISTDASQPRSLRTFEFKDRNHVAELSWCIHGGQILIRPTTDAGPRTYRFTYVPTYADLVADGDTITVPQHWEVYAVLQAAIRLRNMQELSASGLEQRRDAVETRIRNAARKRTGPRKVRDVRGGLSGRWGDWQRLEDWRFDS
jgi:hypothetical protein